MSLDLIFFFRYDSAWMVDPVVAMIIALWIVFNWASTGSELSRLIMGQAASPIYIQYLTHIAMHHDERIKVTFFTLQLLFNLYFIRLLIQFELILWVKVFLLKLILFWMKIYH